MLRTLSTALASIGVAASVATAAPPRIDGVLHQRGTSARFLLVRVHDLPTGYLDAVYIGGSVRPERLRVRGVDPDAFLVALAGRAYFDLDCGAQPMTIEQVELEPRGANWRRTEWTYVLRARTLVLQSVTRQTVTGAAAGHRRCALDRGPPRSQSRPGAATARFPRPRAGAV